MHLTSNILLLFQIVKDELGVKLVVCRDLIKELQEESNPYNNTSKELDQEESNLYNNTR